MGSQSSIRNVSSRVLGIPAAGGAAPVAARLRPRDPLDVAEALEEPEGIAGVGRAQLAEIALVPDEGAGVAVGHQLVVRVHAPGGALVLRPAEQVLDMVPPFVARDEDGAAAPQRPPELPVEVEVVVGRAVEGVRRVLTREARPDQPVALAVDVTHAGCAQPPVAGAVVPGGVRRGSWGMAPP